MHQKLEAIKRRIHEEEGYRKADECFGGAGLIICPNNAPLNPAQYPGRVLVRTRHAKELSALLEDLREAMNGRIDHLNKYLFYPQLGKQANRYLRKGDELKELLLTVTKAAIEFEGDNNCQYFAYGSNMDRSQMVRRCPDAALIGKARLYNHKFELDEEGVATVTPKPGSQVEGLLWLISPKDRDRLDRYEGVSSKCYRQEWYPITGEYGQKVCALVYVSERGPNRGQRRDGYMNKILKAAEEQQFSEAYLKDIRRWS